MPASFPPLLISFEGIDGSGKSTQAARLVERLRNMESEPLAVREPGGTHVSEQIRTILLDPEVDIAPRAELLLFAAARAQLVDEAIRPALYAGRPVICDRFFDSTTAYQGAGRGLGDVEWLNQFHRFTTAGLEPHRTFILDVSPDIAASRRLNAADRMEAAGDDFFQRVRAGYHQIAGLEPDRVVLLDGTAKADDLHEQIWTDLARLALEQDFSAPVVPHRSD